MLQCAVALQRLCNHCCTFCPNAVGAEAAHTTGGWHSVSAAAKFTMELQPGRAKIHITASKNTNKNKEHVLNQKTTRTTTTQCQRHCPHRLVCTISTVSSLSSTPSKHMATHTHTHTHTHMQPIQRCTDSRCSSVLLLFSAPAIAAAPPSPMSLAWRLHTPQRHSSRHKKASEWAGEHSGKPLQWHCSRTA